MKEPKQYRFWNQQQVDVDAHDSDYSFHMKNTQPVKRISKSSDRKRSALVEVQDNMTTVRHFIRCLMETGARLCRRM